MIGIPCICVDDSKKPSEIPKDKWVVKDEKYHITHIFKQKNQNNIKGCELAEHDISDCSPYNCYRLSRFSIHKDDLQKLIEMIKFCDQYNELSDIDINKLVQDVPLKEELV